jgi:hypothetical protein
MIHPILRLRADLATKQLESGQPAERTAAQKALRHWQQDSEVWQTVPKVCQTVLHGIGFLILNKRGPGEGKERE